MNHGHLVKMVFVRDSGSSLLAFGATFTRVKAVDIVLLKYATTRTYQALLVC